jgi:hypothetical protein
VFRFILPVQESNCMSHSLNLNVTLRVRWTLPYSLTLLLMNQYIFENMNIGFQ